MTMLRPVIMLALVMLGAFAAVILLGSTITTQQPLLPAFAGFHSGCAALPSPCWYGIQPGRTPLDEVAAIIKQHPPTRHSEFRHTLLLVYHASSLRCSVELRHDSDVIQSITLTNCVDHVVGDLTRAASNIPQVLGFSLVFQDDTQESRETLTSIFDPTCTNSSPYGAIVGRLSASPTSDSAPQNTAPANQIVPEGWFVVPDKVLSCEAPDDLGLNRYS